MSEVPPDSIYTPLRALVNGIARKLHLSNLNQQMIGISKAKQFLHPARVTQLGPRRTLARTGCLCCSHANMTDVEVLRDRVKVLRTPTCLELLLLLAVLLLLEVPGAEAQSTLLTRKNISQMI